MMSLFLVGGGGHGRVVLDAALATGLAVSGVLDPGLEPGSTVFGVPVLGGDELLADSASSQWLNGIGANPNLAARRRVAHRLSAYQLVGCRHPDAIVSRSVLADGVQVMAGAVIQPGTRIAANAVVNTGARIDHDCAIGAHCFIGPGAILCGDVALGESVFVGAGAIILPGLTIARGVVIGAGSVVTKNVDDETVIVGNPGTVASEKK